MVAGRGLGRVVGIGGVGGRGFCVDVFDLVVEGGVVVVGLVGGAVGFAAWKKRYKIIPLQ